MGTRAQYSRRPGKSQSQPRSSAAATCTDEPAPTESSKASKVRRVLHNSIMGLARVDAHDDAAGEYVTRHVSRLLGSCRWFQTAPYAVVHPAIVYLIGRSPTLEPARPKIARYRDGTAFLTANIECAANAVKNLTKTQFGFAMARAIVEMIIAHALSCKLPSQSVQRALDRLPPYPSPNPFRGLRFLAPRKRPDPTEPTLDLTVHIPVEALDSFSSKQWVEYFDRIGSALDAACEGGAGDCDTFEHGQGEATFIIAGRDPRRMLAAAKRALQPFELPAGVYFTIQDRECEKPARRFAYSRK